MGHDTRFPFETPVSMQTLSREKYRIYLPVTVRMSLVFAIVILLGWMLEWVLDPAEAPGTITLRLTGGLTALGMFLVLPRLSSPGFSSACLYAATLLVQFLFTMILSRISGGIGPALGAYLYFLFGSVLLGLPYSFFVNATGSIALTLGPHLWSLIIDTAFPHLLYATLIWPACAVVLVFHYNAHKLITDRLRDRARITEMSRRDSLTGLLNRRALEEEFLSATSLAQRRPRPVSLLMLDIDHFKILNDNFGHLTGDQVLAELAAIMQRSCRTSDAVARIGGEEFICLMPDTDLEAACVTGERLRASIQNAHTKPPFVTISLGAAQWRETENLEDLIRRADSALYEAKTNGRNRLERA